MADRPQYHALTQIEFSARLGMSAGRCTVKSIEKWTGLGQRQLSFMADPDIEARLDDALDAWLNSFLHVNWNETP